MKLYKFILSVLLFSTFSSYVIAAETGYELELIIFEDTQTRYLKSEDWSYNDMLNNSDIASPTYKIEDDSEFKVLDWNNAKLADSLNKVKSTPRYNVLINKRWKQTGLDRDKAYYMDITSLNTDIIQVNKRSINSEPALSVENSEENSVNYPKSYINGRVKLVMSRYLHFEVNLNYFKLDDDSLEKRYISYPIVSERRMKSREVHYIDHPMVGVIVLATPYEIVEKPLASSAVTTKKDQSKK